MFSGHAALERAPSRGKTCGAMKLESQDATDLTGVLVLGNRVRWCLK
jgi:hypothetical protein